MSAGLDLADLQGNILRGYHKPVVRHLVVGVREPEQARRWLLAATGGDSSVAPQVTDAQPWDERPDWCLNVSFTHAGLAALGTPAATLDSFPEEFQLGMAARAVKLGDTGPSDPETWKPEWRDPKAVHLMVSIHADRASDLDDTCARVLGAAEGNAFSALAQLDGASLDGGRVHFGYVDGIAQPRFAGLGAGSDDDPSARADGQPAVELGAALLGHPTPIEDVSWEVPQPDELGHNGCFGAFRVLEQQVEAFEAFLDEQADALLRDGRDRQLLPAGVEASWDPPVARHEAVRELLAAKLCGRWRNGTPLVRSPTTPHPLADDQLNDFGFADDPDGLACPMASHIRRCNPRDARIVQRSTNHSRRLVRRGFPYGPVYDPAIPTPGERGLLGMFLCASLVTQFEAVQYDWINLGLQDPRITPSNDPVVGNNDPAFSVVQIPTASGDLELRGFPRFVHTRGGAYLILPSIPALRWLGGVGS